MAGSEKKHRRSASLFIKYVSFFSVVEIISLSVLGWVLMYFVADSWEDEQKRNLFNYADNIAGSYAAMLSSSDTGEELSYSVICYTVTNAAQATSADIFIVDSYGNMKFCKDMADTDDMVTGVCTCKRHSGIKVPGEIYTGVITDGMMATTGKFNVFSDEDSFISASVVKNIDNNQVEGIVFAVQPLSEGLKPYLSKFVQNYVLAAFAFLLISGLIIYVKTFKLTKPLRKMSEATKHYAKGDFSYKLESGGRGTAREFEDLSTALNSMADDLEKIENSRTNFVANVSHELKTPMTTIGGFIDGILDGTIDKEHQDAYLKIVSDEVKRLSRLVVSMLNMTKMDAGELRINPVKFNLTEQIINIFISFEQKIEEKKINVKGLERLHAAYIEADPDMINQVFYNLIDNATKFTQQGGDITVSMKNDGEYVTVSIRNTGKGIDSEDIDHVFERFYKGDKSRSLDSKSAGLGLFIVKNIVELHNGEISVRSEKSRYTEFSVKLKIDLMGGV